MVILGSSDINQMTHNNSHVALYVCHWFQGDLIDIYDPIYKVELAGHLSDQQDHPFSASPMTDGQGHKESLERLISDEPKINHKQPT